MAKQQRASSRSSQTKAADVAVSDPRIVQHVRETSVAPARTTPPAPRAGHAEALAAYEEGMAALQAHEFSRASSVLRSVLSRYPDERELHERVRLYLNVCERHIAPRTASPTTSEERVLAATLAANAGNFQVAIEHLRTAIANDPQYDHAFYMLASVLALRDEFDEAVTLLLRAIALNPDNRSRARHDPDLFALREFASVRAVLEAAPEAKPDRSKAPRRR